MRYRGPCFPCILVGTYGVLSEPLLRPGGGSRDTSRSKSLRRMDTANIEMYGRTMEAFRGSVWCASRMCLQVLVAGAREMG